jgi:hypothetical protein
MNPCPTGHVSLVVMVDELAARLTVQHRMTQAASECERRIP